MILKGAIFFLILSYSINDHHFLKAKSKTTKIHEKRWFLKIDNIKTILIAKNRLPID